VRLKFLKGFFEVASPLNPAPYANHMVRLEKDLAVTEGGCEPEQGMVYVESCPPYAGMYGYVCSAGYILPTRLIPMRNIKANREKIRAWAGARRQGIARSKMWYDCAKACQSAEADGKEAANKI